MGGWFASVVLVYFQMLYLANAWSNAWSYGRSEAGFGVSSSAPAAGPTLARSMRAVERVDVRHRAGSSAAHTSTPQAGLQGGPWAQ